MNQNLYWLLYHREPTINYMYVINIVNIILYYVYIFARIIIWNVEDYGH